VCETGANQIGLASGGLGCKPYSDATKNLAVFELGISSTKDLILQGILAFPDERETGITLLD
jgi:hypothetical protein